MTTIDNVPWIINDYTNTLLMFTLIFISAPKIATKFNITLVLIVGALFTWGDFYVIGVSDVLVIPLCFYLFRKSESKFVEKILVFLMSYFVCFLSMGVGNNVETYIFPYTQSLNTLDSTIAIMIVVVVSYVFALSVYYVVIRLIRKFKLEYIFKDTVVEWIITISLSILTILELTMNVIGSNLGIQQMYIGITLTILMITIIFISIGVIVFVAGHLNKVKADYELQQINERNAYINGLENKNNELRRFKHDYKNFLLSLSASIENNDQDDSEIVQRLLNYADVNLKNNTKPSDANLYKINDKLIRGIIITKIMIARDKGIQTDVEIAENVEIPQKSSIDITRILGILFDNAIEASLKNPKPELDFALISYDESIEFVFKNNVDPSLKIEMNKIYNNGYSTKSDHNGLGLATVKQIVNSNKNFLLQTKFENAEFSTVLTSIKIN